MFQTFLHTRKQNSGPASIWTCPSLSAPLRVFFSSYKNESLSSNSFRLVLFLTSEHILSKCCHILSFSLKSRWKDTFRTLHRQGSCHFITLSYWIWLFQYLSLLTHPWLCYWNNDQFLPWSYPLTFSYKTLICISCSLHSSVFPHLITSQSIENHMQA